MPKDNNKVEGEADEVMISPKELKKSEREMKKLEKKKKGGNK